MWGCRCGRVSGGSVTLLGLRIPPASLCSHRARQPRVCVWNRCFPDGTSHQPVLRRSPSLMHSPAMQASLFLLPRFSPRGSLLVSVTPPSCLQASPHLLARPASSAGPAAHLLFQPGLLVNTHTTPNGPALLSWGHIIHNIVGCSIQLIFTFTRGRTLC